MTFRPQLGGTRRRPAARARAASRSLLAVDAAALLAAAAGVVTIAGVGASAGAANAAEAAAARGAGPQAASAAAARAVPVSSLRAASAVNGLGRFERNKSVGGKRLGDGKRLTINGKRYSLGLGVHAPSVLVYKLHGKYSGFRSYVGIDDEVGRRGSVVFRVYVDGKLRYSSPLMRGTDRARGVAVGLRGARTLKLVVGATRDGRAHDHADWASARLLPKQAGTTTGGQPTTPTDGAGNTPASGACMPSPAACGYPDVSTTGVQPGVTLSPASGTVHLATPGMVYENRLVTGDIIVEAPNVTIRNVKLVNQNPSYGISVKNGGSWQDTQAGLLLDHVEIDLGGTMDGNGIAFNGYTARHVFFHNGADCAAMGQNVLIEDSLCVDGPDANGDGWPDSTGFCNGPEHIDGFQSDGGSGITLRHNTMRNPCEQTSNILLSSNTGHISNARVEDNLLAGGGYSLYCAGMADRSSVTNIVATGNRIARTYFPRGGKWGPTAYCEYADTFSGNVWDDTGKPLQ